MKTVIFGNYRVELHDEQLDVMRSLVPAGENAAQIGRGARDGAATGGARKGNASELAELVILLGPSSRPEGNSIAWFKPVRAAGCVDRKEHPVQLLIASKVNAYGHDGYRVLAEVYHLDTQAVVAESINPAARQDAKLDPRTIKIAPQVDHSEHGAQHCDGKGNGFLHAAEQNQPATEGQA